MAAAPLTLGRRHAGQSLRQASRAAPLFRKCARSTNSPRERVKRTIGPVGTEARVRTTLRPPQKATRAAAPRVEPKRSSRALRSRSASSQARSRVSLPADGRSRIARADQMARAAWVRITSTAAHNHGRVVGAVAQSVHVATRAVVGTANVKASHSFLVSASLSASRRRCANRVEPDALHRGRARRHEHGERDDGGTADHERECWTRGKGSVGSPVFHSPLQQNRSKKPGDETGQLPGTQVPNDPQFDCRRQSQVHARRKLRARLDQLVMSRRARHAHEEEDHRIGGNPGKSGSVHPDTPPWPVMPQLKPAGRGVRVGGGWSSRDRDRAPVARWPGPRGPMPSRRMTSAKSRVARTASRRCGVGEPATNVPWRPRVSTSPAASSSRYERATVLTARWRSPASCRTVGSRSSGSIRPESMRAANWARTCSNDGTADCGSTWTTEGTLSAISRL